jgi:quercetin dioxygenase-like cupin family protein
MNKNGRPDNKQDAVLNEDELILLSAEHAALDEVDVDSTQMKSLRSRVMAQLDEQPLRDIHEPMTVRSDSGDWQQVSDKIRKKMLYVDEKRGITSFLLRVEPGAEDAPHQHTSDEHCMVIEGDISFGDIHLHAGDYHLAPKGSWHEKGYSEHGALLFIQTGIEQQAGL